MRLLAAALTFGIAIAGHAQTATARARLNVRSGQSTSSQIVDHLAAGESADLVEPIERLGYFHIGTSRGIVGWAWAQRIDTAAVASVAGGSTDSTAATTTTAGIRSSWHPVATNAADYQWPDGNHAVCAAGGAGGDAATNVWKNRTDSAVSYHPVSWNAIATLDFPHNKKKHREGTNPFTPSELAALAKYEGLPIAIEGYLSGAKEEIPAKNSRTHLVGKGEATNCGENTSPRVDWHVYLTDSAHERHSQAIVVETTPRVRPEHPEWSLSRLQQFTNDGTRVRISGWLMFDPEHWDQMWQYTGASDTTGTKARISLWEIHPITKIEYLMNGVWTVLK